MNSGIYFLPFSGCQIIAAYSGREISATWRKLFLREIGILPENLQLVKQVHGSEILVAEEKINPATEADGLITAAPQMALGILTADCVPVFFWDSVQEVVGLAHAGWRGLRAGIISKTILKFRQEFESKPATIQIALGPAIRKCCYEVGEEFKEYFPQYYEIPKSSPAGRGHVDLIAAAHDQAAGEGIPVRQIFDSGICTSCQNSRFFSARKEQTLERMLSVIQIR